MSITADINPVAIVDNGIDWNSVGGLKHRILPNLHRTLSRFYIYITLSFRYQGIERDGNVTSSLSGDIRKVWYNAPTRCAFLRPARYWQDSNG